MSDGSGSDWSSDFEKVAEYEVDSDGNPLDAPGITTSGQTETLD